MVGIELGEHDRRDCGSATGSRWRREARRPDPPARRRRRADAAAVDQSEAELTDLLDITRRVDHRRPGLPPDRRRAVRARQAFATHRPQRIGHRRVMDRWRRRSRGVSQTAVVEAREAPAEADLAFDRLYRSSRDDVYAYVASLLHDGPAAEEVTATAFERAYRKRGRFDPRRGEPRAWLFGIARNAALDELRRRGRQAELAAEPADLDGAAVDAGAEQSEQRLALRAALAHARRRASAS